jgi:hypothetical protein
MCELPTQLTSIVLEIVNVQAIVLMTQDGDDTNWEIGNDESENPAMSMKLSEIEEDDLDFSQEVLHLDLVRRDRTRRIK